MSLLNGITVLVVEDDEILREILVDIFKSEGAIVVEAANGKIAFECIKSQNFDVLFSDVRMPVEDGVSLIKNIRSYLNIDTKIFFCSGFHDLTDQEIKTLGVLEVFQKPFDQNKIVSRVASFFVVGRSG